VSFRRRIALASAAAVAIAVVLASLLVYLLTAHQLRSELDAQLRGRGHSAARLAPLFAHNPDLTSLTKGAPLSPAEVRALKEASRPLAALLTGKLPPRPDQVRGYQQLVTASGSVLASSPQPGLTLPVDAATRALARQGGAPVYRDATVQGVHLRLLAEPFGAGTALQLAQPLSEQDSLLSRLRLILALICAGGIALAALLGRLVAGTAVLPLRRLTEATEHVTATQDLSGRIAPAGEDELGRLASSFNAMLDALGRSMQALDESVHAQRQLVADASHELRTPVTSLRTNIEILQQSGPGMDGREHARLLADVVEQTEELALLVNDLIDLARGEQQPAREAEEVRLDVLVEEVVERARRRAPQATLQLALEPTVVVGVPSRLDRATGNLVDNAIKHGDPARGPVLIALRDGELTVRDHGPGIAAEDLPCVFDRFYRGADARQRPGSGLGLAIVRQVAEQHGGTVTAERAPGGGALMRLRLPTLDGDGDGDGATGAARPAPAAQPA
jgi:two-component system sensor histidine kinase MprB